MILQDEYFMCTEWCNIDFALAFLHMIRHCAADSKKKTIQTTVNSISHVVTFYHSDVFCARGRLLLLC